MFQFTWTILLWKITNIITTMQLHQLIVYKYINIKNNQRILYTKKIKWWHKFVFNGVNRDNYYVNMFLHIMNWYMHEVS